MEKQVCPAADNRCQDSCISQDCMAAARTNHGTAISNCTDHASRSWVQVQYTRWSVGAVVLQICAYHLSWDIRLFVWRKHRLYVKVICIFFSGSAVSCICITQTTAFSCYGFHFMYMHAWCVSCNWGRHNATWLCERVIAAFISLWKLKFLAYLLNVTQRVVMRIISYANIVYFIFN